MPKERERLLLSVLDKAAELSRGLEDPSEAVYKAAAGRGLTAPEVCRVAEMYNKAKSVAFLKAASSDRRAEDFPLARPEAILSRVFEDRPAAASKSAAESRPVDFASRAFQPAMVKAASAERFATAQPSPATAFRKQAAAESVVKASEEELRRSIGKARTSAECLFHKLAGLLEPLSDEARASFAQNVVNAHGVARGAELIAKTASKSRFCRMSAPLAKTASAVFLPADAPYIALSQIVGELDKAAAAEAELAVFFSKTAAGEMGVADNIVSMLGAGGAPSVAEGLDPDNGMPAKLSGALKAVESKADFLKLYKFDPVLNGYPLMDALQAYNDIRRTTPSLAGNKLWIRAAMRRYLTQGGMLDQFELKDMLGTGAAKTKERGDQVGYADSASIRPDKEYA
jgi:hypothetical protein